MPSDELLKLAAQLGADVPACVKGVPARVSGIGERITPLPGFPGLPVLLVNPLRAVSHSKPSLRPAQVPLAHRPPSYKLATRDIRALTGDLSRTTRNDLTAAAQTLITGDF